MKNVWRRYLYKVTMIDTMSLTTQQEKTSVLQHIFRILLGSFMIVAGIGHLSFSRIAFQAQVPDWVPMDKDTVVLLSGIVEIALGAGMVFWIRGRIKMGMILAVFYVLVFPGNIAQYVGERSAFGLNSDTLRLLRLFFQPVLILWALWSTGALKALMSMRRSSKAPERA